MRKIFKGLLSLIMVLIILISGLGVAYSFYVKGPKNAGDINVSGDLSVNYENGRVITIEDQYTTKVSIINDSEEPIFYYIEYKNVKNAKDVTYTVSDGKEYNIEDKLNSYNTIISQDLEIEAGAMKTYIFTFTNNSEEPCKLELNISAEFLETDTFADIIIKNSSVKTGPITEVGKSISNIDEGLIQTTDDYGTAYYFRGKVANNNVKIGDYNFKIVKINGDGSVKLVLDGDTEVLKKYYDNIDAYSFKESLLYAYLNSWITENLYKYKSLLANYKYCNDISSDNDNVFYAYNRIVEENIPSFVCLGTKFSSKVALLTVDEVIYAGATVNENNKDFYLYNENIEEAYYLMSSASISDKGYKTFMVSKDGKVVYDEFGTTYNSVRPVITIIKTAIAQGTGTVNDPYILTNA